MKPIALLAACLLAGVGAFVAPSVPKTASSSGRTMTMRAAEAAAQATRQQQLSGLVKGLGLAGLGAAFLAGRFVRIDPSGSDVDRFVWMIRCIFDRRMRF